MSETYDLVSREKAVSLGLHFHCLYCYNSTCTFVGTHACPVINCSYCLQPLHNCKKDDHVLICANAKVDCINASIGCSKRMRRSERGKHLEHCPASVIRCSLTRCRLPVSNYFEGFCMHLEAARSGSTSPEQPLDLALFLRDYISYKHLSPRKETSSTRTESNTLQKTANRANSERRCIASVEHTRVTCALCMCKSNRDAVASVSDAAAIVVPKCYSAEELEHFNAKLKAEAEPKVFRMVYHVNLKKESTQTNDMERVAEPLSESNIESANSDTTTCDVPNSDATQPTQPDGYQQVRQSPQMQMQDGNESERTLQVSGDDCLEQASGKMESEAGNNQCNSTNSYSSAQSSTLDYSSVPFDVYFEYPTRWNLDLNSHFQFACGQLLRRDEFTSHVRNVHVDNLTQLSWCEQRCPLAYRGCTFVQRRLIADSERTLRYLPVFDCVAMRHSAESHVDESRDLCERCGRTKTSGKTTTTEPANLASLCGAPTLTDLPIELLVILFGYLDSLSLRALAATCSSLRAACSMLLADRGCITPKWYARTDDSTTGSSANRKTWMDEPGCAFFSNAFESVDRWHVQDAVNAQVTSHLQTCAFNERAAHDPRIRFVTDELRGKVEDSLKRVIETARERNPFVNTLQRYLSLSDRN